MNPDFVIDSVADLLPVLDQINRRLAAGQQPKAMKPTKVVVNGKAYRWPQKSSVVVCIDGGDLEYIQWLSAKGLIPNIARFIEQGFSTVAQGAMPSFTCPNNMSIVTGTPV